MGILDEDVVRVREGSDIVAVIGGHTQLKRVGTRWSGLCPFHNEKSASFSVNATEGLYYCFGCRASGDVITFVREIEHLDFVGAVEWLAGKAGISLRYTEANEGESRKRIARLQEVMERAVDWYHDRLLSAPDAGVARGYLRQRGFDRDAVDRFRVGWAPDAWDELAKSLKVSPAVFEECGLGFVNKANRLQDFFRARILFPIFDDQGRAVAFGGRKLPDAEGAKYQNSREGTLYNKSRTLYALNWAKADVVASGEAIVCEGYTDVIGFFAADLPRAVATCGTALTEDHVRHLKRFTNRMVLAYDADEAGQAAAERVYEWEQRHEIEIAVLGLPAGTDPDELAQQDPGALRAAVAAAKPFLGFRVDRVLRAANLATPEGRARAASLALDAVREHPSEFVRDQYVMQIADACRAEPEWLREELRRPASPRAGDAKRVRQRPVGAEWAAPPSGSEVEALRLMVQRPAEIAARLGPELFVEGPVRRAYLALREAGSVHGALEDAEPAVADLLRRVSVEESRAEADDIVVRLLTATVTREIAELEQEARHAEDPLDYVPSIQWLKLRLDEIRGDEPAMEAAGQLIVWLAEHAAGSSC
ncbi:MAG TPA: DNA primase [Microthrixaceae bacterium]|nr:DNA primase [Microthrixaceae bacterium]